MERLGIELFSTTLNVWLFTQVQNSSRIKESLIQASLTSNRSEQARLDWAFLDASMITSRQHLLTAVVQALVARSHGELKTKTLHSEILWALSPGTNIMDAIKKFGLGSQTTEILLVKLQPTADLTPKDDLDQAAKNLMEGKLVSLDQLGQSMVNWKELRRLYKLNDDAIIKEQEKKKKRGDSHANTELNAIIDRLVTSTVALKSVAA